MDLRAVQRHKGETLKSWHVPYEEQLRAQEMAHAYIADIMLRDPCWGEMLRDVANKVMRLQNAYNAAQTRAMSKGKNPNRNKEVDLAHSELLGATKIAKCVAANWAENSREYFRRVDINTGFELLRGLVALVKEGS